MAFRLHSTEHPYCHILSPKFKSSRCDQCFAKDDGIELKLKLCTQCRVVKYCSITCQRAAWTLHKIECKALKKVAPKIPTESVLLIHRLLILYKLGKHKEQHDTKFGKRSFTDLMSHYNEIKNDEKRSEDFMDLIQTLNIFNSEVIDVMDPSQLFDLFGKMCINSFTICDGEMQPLGVGIYIGASTLDHSCRPNTITTFDGIKLQVVTCVKGQGQMFISYIEQLSTLKERQTQLEEQYYFTCQCPMCKDTFIEQEMQSTKCPVLNCDGIILEKQDEFTFEQCTKCGHDKFDGKYTSDKSAALTDCKKRLKESETKVKEADYSTVLSTCESCILNHQTILSPVNIYRLRLMDKILDACIELGEWDKAKQYGVQTIDIYRKYYHPSEHPLLGIQLLKVGKIELYLQDLPQAMKHLQQAESILKVSHGSHHSIYKDLIQLLDQCAEESRVNMQLAEER